jgi:FkbM family methyltransferase
MKIEVIDKEMLLDSYEPGTRRVMGSVLKEGDSFLIAGAHQGGLASYAASLVGPGGKVYAFEPEPDNYEILQKTVEPFGNVTTYNFALGDREREAILFKNLDNSGGHALYDVSLNPNNVKTREAPKVISVMVKTLEDVLACEDLSNLKLILLDAEGAEYSIIRGGINLIVDYDVPYIICEINNFAMKQCLTTQLSLRSYMSMYGYKCFVINEDRCVDVGKGMDIKCFTPDGDEVVFNVLFSRKGAV